MQENIEFKRIFIQVISIIWLVMAFFLLFPEIKNDFRIYKGIVQLTLDEKRALVTGWDFYNFLKLCDEFIPKGKDIKWIFPKGKKYVDEGYFFQKASYCMHPRDYRQDAEYVIVYGVKDYAAPSGFKIVMSYGENGYILFNNKAQ